MEKRVKIYNLHDEQQYEDEKEYWKSKTPEERLHALEVIRKSMAKLINTKGKNGDEQRLRRVIRVIKRA